MADRDGAKSGSSPYGRAGVSWWVALLLGVVVVLPSTAVLTLPMTIGQPGLPLLGVGMCLLGAFGVLGATINSLLCKSYGWWPLPVALLAQWSVAALVYPIIW